MFCERSMICGPTPGRLPRCEPAMGEPGSPGRRGPRIRWPASDDSRCEHDVVGFYEKDDALLERLADAGLWCPTCEGYTALAETLAGGHELIVDEGSWAISNQCDCPEPTGDCPPLEACPTCWRWTHEGCKCGLSEMAAMAREILKRAAYVRRQALPDVAPDVSLTQADRARVRAWLRDEKERASFAREHQTGERIYAQFERNRIRAEEVRAMDTAAEHARKRWVVVTTDLKYDPRNAEGEPVVGPKLACDTPAVVGMEVVTYESPSHVWKVERVDGGLLVIADPTRAASPQNENLVNPKLMVAVFRSPHPLPKFGDVVRLLFASGVWSLPNPWPLPNLWPRGRTGGPAKPLTWCFAP